MAKKLTQNVNKDKLLNDLPKVSPGLSTWLNRHTNYQSCNIGEIVPVYYEEILPNEKKMITMSMISHTVTPIAPIFNSIYTELRSFFVPMRLAADLLNGYKSRKSPWVKVFGEDNASSNADIVIPLDQQKLPDFTTTHKFIQNIDSYIQNYVSADNVFNSLDLDLDNSTPSELCDFNYLHLAAYELIYQRWYRNENYESATSSSLYRLLFDAYNVSKASISFPSDFTFEIANREKDYFTGMKPFTLKANSPVKVPLVGNAPVIGVDSNGDKALDDIYLTGLAGGMALRAGGTGKSGLLQVSSTNVPLGSNTGMGTGNNYDLFADLSQAQGVSIEELRILIKTQELLEKDAMYGSRYAESLNSHFGCCPLDTTLQDPQELYKTTITSNMQAIFQTSSTSGEASILGTIGANSTTQTDPFVILPETKFKEHGILMICAVHKLQNVYNSVFFKPKFISKKARFDFYTPELNDLGFQPVTNKEMRSSVSEVAGYNEAFAEYRFVFNKVHGRLPYDFPYWAPSISDEYAAAGTLYKEDPDILDAALSVQSESVPQFYDAWGFEEKVTKPMSLHSIPGFDGVI